MVMVLTLNSSAHILGIPEDRVVRCLLARMPANVQIPVHHDTGMVYICNFNRVVVSICIYVSICMYVYVCIL
ncbi:hypothetical protein EON63_24235, partial [archaeon]